MQPGEVHGKENLLKLAVWQGVDHHTMEVQFKGNPYHEIGSQ